MTLQTDYMSFEHRWTISSGYNFQANQQWSQRWWCFSQMDLLWFMVLSNLLQVLRGVLLTLPGARRCTQSSYQWSKIFPNLSQSLPWYFCTSHHWSKLLRSPVGMPSEGLILSWNNCILVPTPHPLRHSWKLPVNEMHFADGVSSSQGCFQAIVRQLIYEDALGSLELAAYFGQTGGMGEQPCLEQSFRSCKVSSHWWRTITDQVKMGTTCRPRIRYQLCEDASPEPLL